VRHEQTTCFARESSQKTCVLIRLTPLRIFSFMPFGRGASSPPRSTRRKRELKYALKAPNTQTFPVLCHPVCGLCMKPILSACGSEVSTTLNKRRFALYGSTVNRARGRHSGVPGLMQTQMQPGGSSVIKLEPEPTVHSGKAKLREVLNLFR
jgi:hypothetical protein